MNIQKSNKDVKALLISPPLSPYDTIYSAIPILLGQLKHNNIDADALDFNIEFLKEITSSSYIKYTKNRLEKIYKNNVLINKNVSYKYQLNQEQLNNLNKDIEKLLFSKRKLLYNLINLKTNFYNQYIRSLKNEEKYDIKKYVCIINYIIKLAFLPFGGENVQFSSSSCCVMSKNDLYKYVYEDIVDKCSNKLRNIYIKIFEDKIKNLKLNKYDVIGITIPFEQNLYPALTLARLLKEKTNAKIVLGGIQITSLIESYIKHSDMFGTFFDHLLIGEGEKSIVDYVRYVNGEIPITQVCGLVYKENNIIKQNKIIAISNIEDIAPPCFDGIDFSDYQRKTAILEFSKGCYWHKCSFCYNNLWKKYHIKKPIKAVNVIEEIQSKYKINYFQIVDDALNINFAEKFADEILRRNIKINYDCFFRTEKVLTYELLAKLKKSGLSGIFFGIESASEKILQLMNKGIDINVAERILKDCYKLNIFVSCGFIYGFPTEEEADLIKTIEFIKRNKEYIDNINNFKFTIMKSSAILTLKDQLNIRDEYQPEEFSDYIEYKSSGISEERLNKLLNENNINILNKYTKWIS